MLSNFDKTVRGLSSTEMLECAKVLLERLSGGGAAGNAGAVRPGAPDIGPAGRGGSGDAGPAGLHGGKHSFRDLDGTFAGAPAFGGGTGSPDTRRDGERLIRQSQRPDAGTDNTPVGVLRRSTSATAAAAERNGPSTTPVPASAGAAFQGPEHRYDPAAGARGAEMSRVSDFFKRDSRRYDSGCSLKK